MMTTTRFTVSQEAFLSDPVVWPYAPQVLYLGWSRRSTTTSVMGVRESAYENETVTFDKEGRPRKEVSVVDFQGRTNVSREFIYDCSSERPATPATSRPGL